MTSAGQDDWNAHWQHYAAAASSNPAQQMRHGIITSLLKRTWGTRADLRVLDLGCGQGDLLARLHRELPTATLAGFELSTHGVQLTRSKVPRAQVHAIDVFQPSASADGFKQWAHLAVCSEVLEHVDDPVAFLRAARTYLAPQASLIVTVPGGPMSAFDRHIGHRQHFSRRSIAATLEAGGFVVDRMRRAGFPFFNLYRLLVVIRGRRLTVDVEQGRSGTATGLARVTMTIFRGLFRLNFRDFPGGWQIIAVARRR